MLARGCAAIVCLAALAASIPASASGWSLPPAGAPFEVAAPCREDAAKASRPVRPGGAVYAVCDDQVQVLARGIAEAQRQGKLLIVTIGATWCPSCAALQKAMPGPEFFSRTGGDLDYRATFHHIEVVVSTLHKGRNVIVPSGVATERFLRARAGDVAIQSIPFIVVLDPARPERVFARNGMEISDPSTGAQDMARFRALIAKAYDELKAP